MFWKWTLVTLVLVLASAFGLNIPSGYDQKFCDPYPDSGKRDFPQVLQNYLAKIEWNNHLTRQSYFVEEFISHPLNKGTMFITGFVAPGVRSQYITSPATGEFITIYDTERMEYEDGNCEVQPLKTQEQFALPFGKGSDGKTHLLGGQALFDLGSSPVGALRYMGKENVNGIPCDVWSGCTFIKEGYITLKLTYYFSQNDTGASWVMPGGTAAAPVMLKVEGEGQDNYFINQTFNYLYFSDTFPTVDPRAREFIFETPKHAYCIGRNSSQMLPRVPQHFEFRAEIVDNKAKTVQFTREWYDFEANYTRMDFKQAPTKDPQKDMLFSPKTLINDFSTGVSYVMDKFSGVCTAIPIISDEFDSIGLGNTTIRMKTPKEFFNFDHLSQYPYQYMGRHLIRGVETNSWISYRPFPNSKSKTMATYEWFYATNNTIIKAQNVVENLEPIQTTIKSTAAGIDMRYNIYRFSERTPDNRVFDVRSCYEDSGSSSFDTQFSGNWSVIGAQNDLQTLEYWIAYNLERYAGVRSIRVVDIEFDFSGTNMGIRFTILGPAPIKGDARNTLSQVSLQEATDRITEAFTNNQLDIFLLTDPRLGRAILNPVPGTLRVIERRDQSSAYRPTDAPPLPAQTVAGPGLDSGAAASLAFGMLFVGIILSVMSIVIIARRLSKTPAVPYRKDLGDTEGTD